MKSSGQNSAMLMPDRPLLIALTVSLAAHALLLLLQPAPTSPSAAAPLRASLQRETPGAAVEPAQVAPRDAETPREPEERSYPPPAPAATAGIEADAMAIPNPLQIPVAGFDLAGLNTYHRELGARVARFKQYPPEARAAGQEGRVAMRLRIEAGGLPGAISLIGSSGSTALDQAALEMLRLAASHTPVPETLRDEGFAIDLAIDYSLKE
jgi:protein TonB